MYIVALALTVADKWLIRIFVIVSKLKTWGDFNMQLLTKEIRNKLPRLYAQDGKGDKAIVYVKFFGIWSLGHWTWYVTEGEPVLDDNGKEIDFRFFGYVKGDYPEMGYFHLSELQNAKAMGGRLPLVERDMYFKPKPLNQVKGVNHAAL